MSTERIQKILSQAGVCSRREAEEMIIEGRVKVNGRTVLELGEKADPERDVIKVGNRIIRPDSKKVYILLNKPKGYITSAKDPEGRKTVMDLVGRVGHRVYPVGRLDYDTEGLILMTNDGEFANAVTHPSRELPKTYEVKVRGVFTDGELAALANGVRLEDGMTAPAKVKKKKLTDSNSWIELTIHEGRNRQVRRMCEALGHMVSKLKRIKVGPVDLKGTPLAMWRELTPNEVEAVLKAAGKTQSPHPPAPSPTGGRGGVKAGEKGRGKNKGAA